MGPNPPDRAGFDTSRGWPNTRVRLILIALGLLSGCARPAAPVKPTLILWAWDRAEDLRFLKPGEAEVAGLVETWRLRNGGVEVWERKLPLRVPKGVPMTAVLRIESDGSPLPDPGSLDAWLWRFPADRVSGIQIDFDVRQSQLEWYERFLAAARKRIPRVSITAIGSWCAGGRIPGLAREAHEVVPMLFRMGPERERWLTRFRARGMPPECSGAVGISTDEPLAWIPPARRVYVFHPVRWTEEAFRKVCARWL